MKYTIEKLNSSNLNVGVELAHMLWDDYTIGEATEDFKEEIEKGEDGHFLLKANDKYVGFLEISIRHDYVEGTDSSPVGYIEGIFVKEGYRKMKLASKLIDFANDYFKQKGCTEMGSDCELTNELSIKFHKGIGFQEVNRVVCFKKDIK